MCHSTPFPSDRSDAAPRGTGISRNSDSVPRKWSVGDVHGGGSALLLTFPSLRFQNQSSPPGGPGGEDPFVFYSVTHLGL